MRAIPIIAALLMLPLSAAAQDATTKDAAKDRNDPALAQSNQDSAAPSSAEDIKPAPSEDKGRPGADQFITMKPTDFQARLFQDPDKITQTEGKDIYASLCAGCHMPDMKGAEGAGHFPALAGNENVAVGDYPVSVIINGLHGMPPFGQALDDEQIVSVVKYLQTTLPETADIYPPTVEGVQSARDAAEPTPK